MIFALQCLGALTILEFVIWFLPTVKSRQVVAAILIFPIATISLVLIVIHTGLPIILIFIANLYRIVNLLRVVSGRMNHEYLHRMSARASLWLALIQIAVLLAWWISWLHDISTYTLWIGFSLIELLGCIVLALSTIRHYKTTKAPLISGGYADKDLPSLTVAIPARNETEDLERCLENLCESDYPKLEILVLDDCSQNKRTPEIIRSFAHRGVRFIKGTVPEGNWLAKNHAYQQLFQESNGELILFCGVDTRFAKTSLRQLVYTILKRKKRMVSIIPKNLVPEPLSWHSSTLIQPIRYAWELSLPRKLFRRPPVLSTCWIVRRTLLETAGGFAAVSRSIVPESYFARAAATHDGYSFLQSNESLTVESHKSVSEQWDTAVRTRYPQTHRRIEVVMLLTTAEIFGLILPFLLIIAALLNKLSPLLTIISILTVLLMTASYSLIVAITYRRWLLRAIINLPLAVTIDAYLLNYSMYRYEFSDVIWKERNVCVPVMRIENHLPALPPKP